MNKKGFSLLEITVSMAIESLTIIILGVLIITYCNYSILIKKNTKILSNLNMISFYLTNDIRYSYKYELKDKEIKIYTTEKRKPIIYEKKDNKIYRDKRILFNTKDIHINWEKGDIENTIKFNIKYNKYYCKNKKKEIRIDKIVRKEMLFSE